MKWQTDVIIPEIDLYIDWVVTIRSDNYLDSRVLTIVFFALPNLQDFRFWEYRFVIVKRIEDALSNRVKPWM